MIRRRFMRSASTTRSLSDTTPACRPEASRSALPSRASMATTRGCRSRSSCKWSSYSRSIVAKRSIGGNSLARVLTRVVLPAFCRPVTTMFLPARTAARRNDASAESRVPSRTKSVRSMSRTRCLRMTICGRGVVQAMAARRLPSSSRRCRRGLAVVKVRSPSPMWLATCCSDPMSSRSESATAGPRSSRPSA